MYNKNAWASLWNKRKLPQGNMIPCIRASMNLSPSVHEDKEEQCSSIMNSGDKQSPLPPHFGSNRSWGQRGRTGFLKPFRHFYMTELINSLLIPRGVRHRVFPHLPRWSMLAHCLPVWPWFLSIPIDFPPCSDCLQFYFCYYYSFLYLSVIWVFQWLRHIAFNLFFYVLIVKHKFNRYVYWVTSK